MSGSQSSKRRGEPRWLTPAQQRAWLAYIRVQLRMNYDVLVALSNAPRARMRVADLAAQIGWERSRVSHHLRRMCERGLTERQPSPDDGRATDASLTAFGREAITQAAPGHVELVRRLFFDPIPDELLAPLTAALEHVNVNLNLNSSLPPIPN